MLVDFELIKRAQQGDSAAFNEIVLAYRKRIMGTITRLIARPEDVEDVAQQFAHSAPPLTRGLRPLPDGAGRQAASCAGVIPT